MVLSTLPVVARILVWLIVLVPLGIFIWRRVHGIPIRDKRPDGGVGTDATPGRDPVADPRVPLPPLPAAGFGLRVPEPGPQPGTDLKATSPPAPVSSTQDQLPGAGLPAVRPADPEAARAGFFASAPASAEAGGVPPTEGAGRPSVAEAVQGIAMPCGLTPVMDGSTSLPNPFRVLFVTDLASAAEVGRSLADELERLGFSLSTAAPTELLARRDGTELRVVLYPTASSAKRGLVALFPAAAPGAVGVVLAT